MHSLEKHVEPQDTKMLWVLNDYINYIFSLASAWPQEFLSLINQGTGIVIIYGDKQERAEKKGQCWSRYGLSSNGLFIHLKRFEAK